jgi:hypothetical protein
VGEVHGACHTIICRRSPFKSGDISDEYFFDVTQYAAYKVSHPTIITTNRNMYRCGEVRIFVDAIRLMQPCFLAILPPPMDLLPLLPLPY